MVTMLMSLLRNMGDKVDSLGSALAAITRDVRELQVWPSLPQPARAPASVVNTRPTAADCSVYNRGQGSLSQKLPGDCETAPGATSVNMDCQPAATTSWATQVSTPISSGNRFAVPSTDDDDQHHCRSLVHTAANNLLISEDCIDILAQSIKSTKPVKL